MAFYKFQIVIFLALTLRVTAFSCGTCYLDDCPTLSCPGGMVDDSCVCCKQCAKQAGQSCAGLFKRFGQCDKGLVCELIVEVGESVNDDAGGICREVPLADEGMSSLTESSQESHGSSFVHGCELKTFSGCNLVEDGRKCACSEEARTCLNPYQFSNLKECHEVLSALNVSVPVPTPTDCSQARCEIVFDIQCPGDSLKITAQREDGECCPRPPMCLCDLEACGDAVCAKGYEYRQLTEGNGKPGSCCDTYECRPIVNVSNCNGVLCPQSNMEMCPSDSKAVMGGVSTDGCCILPSRCTCALERCIIQVCSQGYSPRRIASGNMEPGSCCDVYECVVGIVTEGCRHNSHTYMDGQSWSVGHCKSCRCESGWAHCIVQQDCYPEETQLCLTPQGIKMPGERWDEDDCTMCECVEGAVACMTSSCVVKCLDPRTVPGICCPVCDAVTNFITMNPVGCPPSNCTLLCPHGYVKDENDCHVCQCLPDSSIITAATKTVSLTMPALTITTTMMTAKSETRTTGRDQSETLCPVIDCTIRCDRGFKTNGSGCHMCECRAESDLCPDMSHCRRECPHGYRQDADGCNTCRCQQCKPMDSCTKSCLYGYQTSRHGCLKCKCNRCPPISDCKKDCTHGYEVNDRGCQICKCHASPAIGPVLPAPDQGLCESVDGLVYGDGEMWHDGCRQCYCSNGQEMCGLITCPVPACSKPVIRTGNCCPTCPDAPVAQQPAISTEVCHSASGQYYVEGETWMMGACTSCLCHSGRVLCSPEVCPPLPCFNPILKEFQCCAECEEVPSPVPDGGGVFGEPCMMPGGLTFQSGATWKEDSCTSCRCLDGEPRCFSQTCPPVNCMEPLLKKGQCCPTCLEPEMRHVCKYGGDIYTEAEIWRVDSCTTCVCKGGKVSCTTLKCQEQTCSHPIPVHGQCCPVCPEERLVHQTKQPLKTSLTDNEDFDATEPVPEPGKPETHKPLLPVHSLHSKDPDPSQATDMVHPPIATKHHPFPVYPVIVSILVVLLVICLILLLLLYVTRRRHRLLYHVNVKQVEGKGHAPTTTTSIKTRNTDLKNSNRDSIRDSAMFKDNLPTKAAVNVTLDSQDLKRYSDMLAVGKSIQPV